MVKAAGERPRGEAKKIKMKAEDLIAKKLEAWGEQFMSAFDDGGGAGKKAAGAAVQKASREGKQGGGGEMKGKKGAGLQGKNPKRPRATAADQGGDSGSEGGGINEKNSDGDSDGVGGGAPPAPAIETVDFSQGGRSSSMEDDLMSKLERRRFMSCKVSKIRKGVNKGELAAAGKGGDDEEEGISAELFKKIQNEVELLGAKQLEGRDKKEWEARRLASLGAKADKAPRMTANIGVGLKRSREVKEQRRIEEQIAMGMLDRKAAAKMRAEADAPKRERGLKSGDGVFKGGVLHVKPPPKKKGGRGGGGSGGGGRGGGRGGGGRGGGRGGGAPGIGMRGSGKHD